MNGGKEGKLLHPAVFILIVFVRPLSRPSGIHRERERTTVRLLETVTSECVRPPADVGSV